MVLLKGSARNTKSAAKSLRRARVHGTNSLPKQRRGGGMWLSISLGATRPSDRRTHTRAPRCCQAIAKNSLLTLNCLITGGVFVGNGSAKGKREFIET